MPKEAEWQDCEKLLPYRDYLGELVLLPDHTQRCKRADGQWEYREREETEDEFARRQF